MKRRANREVQARFPACVPLRQAGAKGLRLKFPFTYPISHFIFINLYTSDQLGSFPVIKIDTLNIFAAIFRRE